MSMESLSKLELNRLLDIVAEGLAICEADEEGITGDYWELLEEAEDMIIKALKTKK